MNYINLNTPITYNSTWFNEFLYCASGNPPIIGAPFTYQVTPLNFFPFSGGVNTGAGVNTGVNAGRRNSCTLQYPGVTIIGPNPYAYNIFGKRVTQSAAGRPRRTEKSHFQTHSTTTSKTHKPDKAHTAAKTKPASKPQYKPAAANNTQKTHQTDLRNSFINTSMKYMGYNEADGSSKKISQSKEWCADFVKYVINETYRNKGLTPPTADLKIEPGMPHLRVENIKQWGIKNGTYLSLENKQNKADTIKYNVKPGDIFIQRRNKASHTGFVTKVYTDGSFDTIEGNRDDKVSQYHYDANDSKLSGFVQVRS